MSNTGYITYNTLKQVYVDSGQPTGITKPNVPEDPDYIPPIYDPIQCPTSATTTQGTNSAIRVKFKNKTGLFLNLGVIQVKAQTLSSIYFNALYQQSPGQTLDTDIYIPQYEDLTQIRFGVGSSLPTGVFIKMDVVWTNADGSSLVRSRVFNSTSIEVNEQLIVTPRVSYGSYNLIVITFTNITPTTTTTTSTTTTTTTSTTTTTTTNPNAPINIFVAPNCAVDSQIVQVRLRSVDDPDAFIDLLSSPVNITDGVVQKFAPINRYIVEVQLAGPGGLTIEIDDENGATTQNYGGAGIYGFNIIDITPMGIVVNFHNAAASSTPLVYARLVESNPQTIYNPTLPWGQVERHTKDIKVKFYSDSAGTIPTTADLDINFAIELHDNINSVSSSNYQTKPATGGTAVSEILLGGNVALKEWNYTLNDPNIQEVSDLIIDETYIYTLEPGFNYLVIL